MVDHTPAAQHRYRPSRSDRLGIWCFVIAGIAITVTTAVFAAIRITDLLGPEPTPVEVQFTAQPADLELGGSAGEATSALPVAVTSATIHVTEMPAASLIAGIIAPALTVLVIGAITACLILLAFSVLRGQIFSKRNSRLVTAAGIVGLLGFPAVNLCHTMLANGALAWASNRQIDNTVFTMQPGVYVLAAFVVALVASVFVVGERMQNDTEGLV